MSSFGDKAKQVIGSIAPLLGTALGGPFGGLAGSLLAKALGTADPKAQEAAIASADPQILLQLKAAESELKEHMRQLDIDEEKLAYDDTANARAREIATKDSTPKILAYLIIGFTFALEGALIFHGAPKDIDGVILGRVLGTLDTATGLVLAYIYGSSAGSAAKTAALNQIAVTK